MSLTYSPAYFWDVLSTLVGRELTIRYKGSLLGLLWAILSPLGTVAILYILFSKFLNLNIPHYAAFIYSGLLPWTWFQASVQTGAATLIDNRDLVRRPFFPRPILPAVVTSTNFVLYLLALPVLLILLMVDKVGLSTSLLALPLVWLVLALFILACTILVSAVGVLIRDIQHILSVVLLLWFYLTPIFYDPAKISPAYNRWLMLNPMAVLVEAHRDLTLYGQFPDWRPLALIAIGSLALLIFSLLLFRRLEDAFVEEV